MIMDRFNLTAEEYLIIELILEGQEKDDNSLLIEYFKMSQSSLYDIIISLQEKGVILKSFKLQRGKQVFIEDIPFNDFFTRTYRRCSGELGAELLAAYPTEAIIQGQAVPLKNFSKKYESQEDFFFHYGKAIGWDVKKHKHVLDLIKWSKEHDLFGLTMNIGDFVGSCMWNSIEEHKDGSNSVIADTFTSV